MGLDIVRWKKQYAKRNPDDFDRVKIITNKQLAARDTFYRRAGFTSWERFWLISQSHDTPAKRAMAAERRGERRQARSDGLSFLEYQQSLKDRYDDNGWRFKTLRQKKAFGALNPFKLIDEAISGIGDEEYKKMRKLNRRAKKAASHKDIAANTKKKGMNMTSRKRNESVSQFMRRRGFKA